MPRKGNSEQFPPAQSAAGLGVTGSLALLAACCAAGGIALLFGSSDPTTTVRPVASVLLAGAVISVVTAALIRSGRLHPKNPRARRRLLMGFGILAGAIVGAALLLGLESTSSEGSGLAGAVLVLGATTGLACGAVIRTGKTHPDHGRLGSLLLVPTAMLWGAVVGIFIGEMIWAGLVAISNPHTHPSTPRITLAVALLGMIVGALTRALSSASRPRT